MPAHAPTVSKLLSKAGHTKSTSSASSIKGWHHVSPGFSVYTSYPKDAGYVIVSYNRGTGYYGQAPKLELIRTELDKYALTLEASGYSVEYKDNDTGIYLHVRKVD